MDKKKLGIYLNDHLAMTTAEIALAKRTAKSNRDNGLGEFLEGYARDLEHDLTALNLLLETFELSRSRQKVMGAKAAEKLGRLKLNGQLFGYSGLSRLEELEGLSLALEGRLNFWKNIAELAAEDATFEAVEPGNRAQAALDQRSALEERRAQAVREAFVS